ncbi:hypothetical protein [Enterococcus faecalis]|nr:hypothetical protein [Enterococcus faecalis]MDU1451420.1 hypothetical protein [Enterococcus faecalis]
MKPCEKNKKFKVEVKTVRKLYFKEENEENIFVATIGNYERKKG